MAVVLLAVFGIALFGARFTGRGIRPDYLSIPSTKAVKGIFVMFVFLRHYKSCVTFQNAIDRPFQLINNWLGQLIVALFLFYSGYGVYESFQKKGQAYVRTIPKKRFLTTLIHFDIAVVLYLLTDALLGITYDWKRILAGFLAWESVGNSNWFIWAMLVLYLASWPVLRFIPSKIGQLAALTAFSAVYVVVFHYYYPNSWWWYDTIFCYVAGMWYSLYKARIEAFLSRESRYWITLAAVLALGRVLFYWRNSLLAYEALAVVFCLAGVMVTMKVSFGNRALLWLGGQVFTIYIIQRLPMLVLSEWGLNAYPYVFLASSLPLALGLAVVFDWFLKKFDASVLKIEKA